MEGYTGEGEPPCSCIVVTPKEQLQAKHNLNLDVQFYSGTVLSSTNKIKIFRVTEQSLIDRFSSPSQGNLMH